MKIDGSGRIVEFAEKVKGDALRAMRVDTSVLGIDAKRAAEAPYIASMGIYVAKASAIRELLSNAFPSANDFGSEVIPGATAAGELGVFFVLALALFFTIFFLSLFFASARATKNDAMPLRA
jgi:ADP-glucose pyrophosphorylase